MKRTLKALAIALMLALGPGIVTGANFLLHQRIIPLTSSTSIAVSQGVTIASEAVGGTAADANFVTLGTSASATVNDLYNSLPLTVTCAGVVSQTSITDYVAATKVASVSPATASVSTAACTYIVGSGWPTDPWKEISFSSTTAGTGLKYSFRAGGIAAGDYVQIAAGVWHTIPPSNGVTYIEFRSVSATDSVYVEWL